MERPLSERLAHRVAGRKLAANIIELCPELDGCEATGFNSDIEFRTAFVRYLAEVLAVKLEKPSELKTMTETEATNFERQVLEFGKHRGLTYAQCPIDYLLWLDEESRRLATYLRSERGQSRQVD